MIVKVPGSVTFVFVVSKNRLYCPIMVKAKKFLYVTPFKGEPKVTDFQLVEEELPELKENGKLSIKC